MDVGKKDLVMDLFAKYAKEHIQLDPNDYYINLDALEKIVAEYDASLLFAKKVVGIIDEQIRILELEMFYGSELNTDWRYGGKDALLSLKYQIEDVFIM